jgi:hypothetical protein
LNPLAEPKNKFYLAPELGAIAFITSVSSAVANEKPVTA